MERIHTKKLWEYIKAHLDQSKEKEVSYDLTNPREHWYSMTRDVFSRFAESREKFTADDLLILTACAYSWMPTIPRIMYTENVYEKLDKAVAFINAIKNGEVDMVWLQKHEASFTNLRGFINNSDVGMSKVLHFLRPDLFPIYDSRVVKNIEKISWKSKTTFLELCENFYTLSRDLGCSMRDIDIIIWSN